MSSQLLIFKLPDVGEGLTEARIISWNVEIGQFVNINEIIAEIETAKSIVDLPSPCCGKVVQKLVDVNNQVFVDNPIIVFEINNTKEYTYNKKDKDNVISYKNCITFQDEHNCNKYLIKLKKEKLNNKFYSWDKIIQDNIRHQRRKRKKNNYISNIEYIKNNIYLLAKPPVRIYAKNMSIDIKKISFEKNKNLITRKDILKYKISNKNYKKIKLSNIRKITAEAVTQSAFNIPHASLFLDVDVSNTIKFINNLKKNSKFVNIKISPLLILSSAIIYSIKKNPLINSIWKSKYIVIKKYINLGIAVSTTRGLLVPNIKNVQKLSLDNLAIQLNNIIHKTKIGKITPYDLSNGSITITNLGTLGVDYGIPIINPGESSIISCGKIKKKPWIVKDIITSRWIVTIGGSFDHRVIDGDVAAKFLIDIASYLKNPYSSNKEINS